MLLAMVCYIEIRHAQFTKSNWRERSGGRKKKHNFKLHVIGTPFIGASYSALSVEGGAFAHVGLQSLINRSWLKIFVVQMTYKYFPFGLAESKRLKGTEWGGLSLCEAEHMKGWTPSACQPCRAWAHR